MKNYNLMYSNGENLVFNGNGFEVNVIIQHAFIEFLKAPHYSPAHPVHDWVKKEKHEHHIKKTNFMTELSLSNLSLLHLY